MKKLKFLLLPLILTVLLLVGVKVSAAETLTGNSHFSMVGWQQQPTTVQEGQVLDFNPTQGTALEAVTFSVAGTGISTDGISYQANSQDYGWMTAVSNGQQAGTTSQMKRLETIKMNLVGALANSYDIYYRAQVQNNGWLGWTKNGAESGSIFYYSNGTVGTSNLMITDLQVFIVKKGTALPVAIDSSKSAEVVIHDTTTPVPSATPIISGTGYTQGVGWSPVQQGAPGGGFWLGNIGQNLSGVKLSISGPVSGGIEYQVNTQGAWQDVSNGQLAGTEGQSFLETINIKLTGDLAKTYTVYYQAYVKGYGWLAVTRDGVNAGSIKANAPIQGLLILLGNESGGLSSYPNTDNPAVLGITNTAVYNSGTDPRAYKYYAIKPSATTGVDMGLYTDAQGPLGIGLTLPKNTSATQTQNYGTMVYADKSVTLADNTNWTHINLNGTWYWINSANLSTHSPSFNSTAYNHDGELRYKDNSQFSAAFDQAVQQWNKVLGGDYLKPADATHPATLVVNDVNQGPNGAPMVTGLVNGSNIPTTGTLTVNTSLIGQGDLMASPDVIKIIFEHELGHALGLNHTGDGTADWSWGVDNDVMRTGGVPSASEILTPQDIAAAQLIRGLKIFAPIN